MDGTIIGQGSFVVPGLQHFISLNRFTSLSREESATVTGERIPDTTLLPAFIFEFNAPSCIRSALQVDDVDPDVPEEPLPHMLFTTFCKVA